MHGQEGGVATSVLYVYRREKQIAGEKKEAQWGQKDAGTTDSQSRLLYAGDGADKPKGEEERGRLEREREGRSGANTQLFFTSRVQGLGKKEKGKPIQTQREGETEKTLSGCKSLSHSIQRAYNQRCGEGSSWKLSSKEQPKRGEETG